MPAGLEDWQEAAAGCVAQPCDDAGALSRTDSRRCAVLCCAVMRHAALRTSRSKSTSAGMFGASFELVHGSSRPAMKGAAAVG